MKPYKVLTNIAYKVSREVAGVSPEPWSVAVGRDGQPPKVALTKQNLEENSILSGLEGAAARAVLEQGELLYLPVRRRIYETDKEITDAYFPIDSVISIVARMKDGTSIEVGTIGREGVSAIPLLLGATSTANESYCQVPGRAVKIPVELFRELMLTTKRFRQLLDRYLQAYVNMLGQLAACNRLHSVYERCARWLLVTQDRVDGDAFALTHEYLAMMLGTGRSGVSIAAATLQNAGFIQYAHGKITILDRAGLETASCECYEVARAQFADVPPVVNGTHDGAPAH